MIVMTMVIANLESQGKTMLLEMRVCVCVCARACVCVCVLSLIHI